MDISLVRPSIYNSTLRLPIKLQSVEEAREEICRALEGHQLPKQLIYRICLSLDEALSNAIEHGSTNIESAVELAYRIENDGIEISITDFGGFVFNPEYFERLATVKDWGAGGRGILLIKSYMDEVYFVFTPHQSTRVIMRKKFPAPTPVETHETPASSENKPVKSA
ncbi:MAG: ATP-binding protein [Candidatus Ozemobacteraceae bacterium]